MPGEVRMTLPWERVSTWPESRERMMYVEPGQGIEDDDTVFLPSWSGSRSSKKLPARVSGGVPGVSEPYIVESSGMDIGSTCFRAMVA